MAFRSANFARLVKFNSAASSDFLCMYKDFVEQKIAAKNAEPKHQTFAPSSFRCPRISWFRLRGVQPDKASEVDWTLNFTAQVGTSCHEVIQSNLEEALGDNWISVADFLKEHPIPYKCELVQKGHETLISIESPPVRFACDGIVFWQGKYYLLEIKTSEYASFDELTDMKPQHIDQINCYGTLLGISDVLMLYQDRQYGDLKCYEHHINASAKDSVLKTFDYVTSMVEANLAPEGLPAGDSWCSRSRCIYYDRCQEWGR